MFRVEKKTESQRRVEDVRAQHGSPTENRAEEFPKVPEQFRDVRPVTPERKQVQSENPQEPAAPRKGPRKSRWDPEEENSPVASTPQAPRFALTFTPPQGLGQAPTQIIRLLNSIQGRLSPTLDTLNFVVLCDSD